MRGREGVFVDSGAWIALVLTRDPLHARAREAWMELGSRRVRLHTSVPVISVNSRTCECTTARPTT